MGHGPNRHRPRTIAALGALLLVAASCGTDANSDDAIDQTTTSPSAAPETAHEVPTSTVVASAEPDAIVSWTCDEIAAQFGTAGSANANLADPVSTATCDGDTVVITSNGIPDYTYVRTSPGDPAAQDHTFEIDATPAFAAETTDVPLLGAAGVTLAGVPIYGPTEGTGGDVLSLEGAISECGSHNGPTGFHLHLLGTSESTDCDFTPEEIAAQPQLLGYAFDGFPIYTGNDQYSSSWELTDESLFAADTWAAHSYVESSGDLDECNGRVDEDGNYAYYTTDTFPYVLGCYVGEVELATADGGRGQGGPPPGEGAGGG